MEWPAKVPRQLVVGRWTAAAWTFEPRQAQENRLRRTGSVDEPGRGRWPGASAFACLPRASLVARVCAGHCAGGGSAKRQQSEDSSGGLGRYRWRHLLRFRRIELRLLLELLLLLFRHVMADGATDHGTGDRVMASNVARHGADCRAFDTAFCCCGLRADSQGEGE